MSARLPQDASSDRANLGLIASLLLEDIDEVKSLRKDKKREDAPPTDGEVAIDLLTEQLRSVLSIHEDRRMAESLAAAIDTDHALIEYFGQMNSQVLMDRAIANRLTQGEDVSPASSITARRTPIVGRRGQLLGPVKSSKSPGPASSSRSLASSRNAPASSSKATKNHNHSPNVSCPTSSSEQ